MATDRPQRAAPSPGRWVGVGHARDPDPARAAASAVEQALAAGERPRLLIAFAAATYDLDLLAAELRAAAPGIPLVGCTTAGELTAAGAHDDSLVVAALGGDGFSVSTTEIASSSDLRAAGMAAAAALGDVADRGHRVLLLLSDAFAGDQQELVRGAYSIAGAGVSLVGACAGDALRMQQTGQLHDGCALRGGVVAAAIGSDAPLGIGVRHGWRSVGEPLHVTRAEGPLVLTLDDRPALDVYLERVGAPREAWACRREFVRIAHTRPIGLRRRDGEEHVRLVVAVDDERRALRTAAGVPQGGLAWVMDHDPDLVAAAGREACAAAVAGLGGAAPIGLLVFAAAARRAIESEPRTVADHAGGAPVAGFYGYGEIARARGVSAFHHQALAVLAVA